MDGEHRRIAIAYFEAGWHPLELPARAKSPPPEGRTGYGGVDLTEAEVYEVMPWSGNIALRMPVDVIGLDIDVYRGGGGTLQSLLARLGPLPNTWISHSSRDDGSGIRFYRVPAWMSWTLGISGVDVIQRNHRYAVVWPSVHPDGRPYAWFDQTEFFTTVELPDVEDLPELPWPWIAEFSRAASDDVRSRAVDHEGLVTFLDEHEQADAQSYIGTIAVHFAERRGMGYSRHDTMQHCLIWAMECVRAGIAPGRKTLAALSDVWIKAFGPDEARRAVLFSDSRTTEFEAMLRHAIGKVEAKPQADIDKLHDDVAGVPMLTGFSAGEPMTDVYQDDFWLDWSAFVNRDEAPRSWLIEGFWPWGRGVALWADAKSGKSELALWCAAKLAVGEHPWTGDRVPPIDVAYFDYEMTADDLEERLAEMDIDPLRLGRLHYALYPALNGLDTEAGGAAVEKLVIGCGAQAVVIDTFTRAVTGEENAADTVRAFFRHTGNRLKALGIGYLRTDHAGKDRAQGQRGSSAKRDDVDVVWSMRRTDVGVELDCTGSSRLNWVEPRLRLDRVMVPTLRYATPVSFGWPAGTADKAAQLDRLGLAVDISKRDAIAALRAASLKPGRVAVLLAALRFRRETAAAQAANTSSATANADNQVPKQVPEVPVTSEPSGNQ
jgi:hypothetical protein